MIMNVNHGLKQLWEEEDGLGTLEMILIIAILIAVAIIFREQITKIISGLLDKADQKSNDFMDS
ncbi:Flp1 family type IVb pilin [Paenibacillus sp. P96]|uniref:Flp1 family type IVb pilin n=2 Tax=Paenibacillus zeirhizosphaerae TaxID=2987519 RepID=A0ABT9FVV8_9BACL|nr:Flp1 family type IVb pilin [Paenibacillus sp. P96]MDP4098872.1 Flp1 family type IVb pilin [Paenibacillus sp. P96]